MKAEELQIGNCVGATLAGNQNASEHPDSIGNGQVLYLIENGADIDNARWYFDIPLTEEWMIKFGFEKHDSEYRMYFGQPFPALIIDKDFEYSSSQNGNLNVRVKLKYVHKLQNLYFALTQNELKCK